MPNVGFDASHNALRCIRIGFHQPANFCIVLIRESACADFYITDIFRFYPCGFHGCAGRKSDSFGGKFLELVPGKRIRHTDEFDDPALPGEMRTTVSLKKVSCGTELTIVQEGIPAVIPVEMCYLGWQESLNQLTLLVEAEIPG